jgi:predicted nucleic acid-binding protein
MDYETKKEIIKSLIFALETSTKQVLIKRLIVEEFIASLNRKKILTNEEAKELQDYALFKLSNF